ncbi:MAG: lysophospholipid acyltransferase family protein [Devosia sp.]
MRTLVFTALRPLLWLLLGFSIADRERLPRKGPAIVAANHNSHLDTIVLLASVPRESLPFVRPVGAADYFMSPPLLRLIAVHLFGILPLERTIKRGSDPLAAPLKALADGAILIIFPEGTRGAPEEVGPLKAGLSRLARESEAPVTPVYLQGAGRILPKGTRVPVPFTCSMMVGEPLTYGGDRAAFMKAFETSLATMKDKAPPLHWT